MYETLGFVSRKWFIELFLLASWKEGGGSVCVCRELFAIKMRRGGGAGLAVARAAECNGTERMHHAPTGHVGICVGSPLSLQCVRSRLLQSLAPCSPFSLPRLVVDDSVRWRLWCTPHHQPREFLSCSTFYLAFTSMSPPRSCCPWEDSRKDLLSNLYCIISDDIGVYVKAWLWRLLNKEIPKYPQTGAVFKAKK
jgi:hypothetical protein